MIYHNLKVIVAEIKLECNENHTGNFVMKYFMVSCYGNTNYVMICSNIMEIRNIMCNRCTS